MVVAPGGPLYGPETITARVVTESVLLLGGPRALLMQLADPAVAAGVADYSGFRADPFGRLVRTLDAMTTISFGPAAAREATLDHLHRVHTSVRGTLEDGTAYEANDPAHLLWVHATLIDTVIQIERRYLGYLRPDERERWYDESKLIARAFAIPESLIPIDLAAFDAYMREQAAVLTVSATARELGREILNPRVPLVPSPLWEPLRLVTIDLLPRTYREGYGLSWDRNRKLLLRSSQVAARLVLPRIPRPVRNLPTTARRNRRTFARAS
ncbi:MAG TPA: oxygenase MpaB family protein [Acidimicrobiia bacterium]|nr:oxygenase MpaB family protein [Acidimicrobiia bacterium]